MSEKVSAHLIDASTTDDKVRSLTLQTEKLKDLVRIISRKIGELLIESAGIETDGMKDDNAAAVKMVDKMKEIVTQKSKEILTEQDKRGLYVLTDNKAKETVEFPQFEGKRGENVYEFVEKFKRAIVANQVAESDKVAKLIKCLNGDARKKIGAHYSDVILALTELESYFGNPHVIWQVCVEDMKKFECSGSSTNPLWGRYGTQTWVMGIASVLEFVRRAGCLASEFKVVEPQVYSVATTNVVRCCIPFRYREMLNESLGDLNVSEKEKLQKIKVFLQKKKVAAQQECQLQDGELGAEKPGKSGGGRSNNCGSGMKEREPPGTKQQNSGHNCYKDELCKIKWHLLGCKELYKITKISDRNEFLKSKARCIRCGNMFRTRSVPGTELTRHRCDWRGYKEKVKCTEPGCYWGAAMCQNQKPDNLSQELKDWLSRLKIRYEANPVRRKKSVEVENMDSEVEPVYNFPPPVPTVPWIGFQTQRKPVREETPVRYSREKLQNGEQAMFMMDDELPGFFESDMMQAKIKSINLRPIPKNQDCLFMLTYMKGKTRDLLVFLDSGCNFWVCRSGVPETELRAVKLAEGPISIGVAGDMQLQAEAEWGAVLPLEDGTHQIVWGLSLDKVTGDMPTVDLTPIMTKLKREARGNKEVQAIRVPKKVGGQVDMIFGLLYAKIYPEPVHVFENGCTLFRTKLLQSDKNITYCIGGPIGVFDEMAANTGMTAAMNWMLSTAAQVKDFKPRTDFFSICEKREEKALMFTREQGIIMEDKLHSFQKEYTEDEFDDEYENAEQSVLESVDDQITGGQPVETLENVSKICDSTESVSCENCAKVVNEDDLYVYSVKGEFTRFMDQQNAGLHTDYKCVKCRNCVECLRGAMYEKVSIRAEGEQQLIKESVWLDDQSKQAKAKLAFWANPEEHLKDNQFIAMKRLENVCRKHGKDPEVVKSFTAGFNKLMSKGFIKKVVDLTPLQQEMLKSSRSRYTIPWDIAFNPRSMSTKARPVMDVSSTTPGGASLNELCAKGTPQLVNLLNLILGWMVGPVALVGDATTFYNCVQLEEEDWTYQRLLLRENLDPNNEVMEAVVTTLIYGVTCVSTQTEQVITLLAEKIWEEIPDVATFLLLHHYVDDFSKSVLDLETTQKLIKATDMVLDTIRLTIKAWTVSGKAPTDKVSEDRISVMFGGIVWYPEVDFWKVYIQLTHFGKKKRGRYPDNLDTFDGKMMKMEDFVKKDLTRRDCTSVMARVFDPTGRLAPLIGWTTPMGELHGLSAAGNIRLVLEKALEGWLDIIHTGSDSEIALMWVQHEHLKLEVFQRNRAINTRMKLDLDQIYHVAGSKMPADVGTRPDLVSKSAISPASSWFQGKPWMRLSVDKAIKEKVIKKIENISLPDNGQDEFKKGVIFDRSLQPIERGAAETHLLTITQKDKNQMADFMVKYQYVYPPLKRGHKSLVRITSYVLLAAKRFKRLLYSAKIRRQELDQSELWPLRLPSCQVLHLLCEPCGELPCEAGHADQVVQDQRGGGGKE